MVIMLDEDAKEAVSKTVSELREKFPLQDRQLDRILRWVDTYVIPNLCLCTMTRKIFDVFDLNKKDDVISLL